MNRKERRAAQSGRRRAKLDRIIAVHESGHAVARVLVAEQTGIPVDHSISHIDVGTKAEMGKSIDGQSVLISQAITFGPMLPEAASAAIRAMNLSAGHALTMDEITVAFDAAVARGLHAKSWAAGRAFIATCGAAAEARHLSLPFASVWNGPQCEHDLRDTVRDLLIARVLDSEMEDVIDQAASEAVATMARPEVWRAVSALADRIPTFGLMPGRLAVSIVRAALQT